MKKWIVIGLIGCAGAAAAADEGAAAAPQGETLEQFLERWKTNSLVNGKEFNEKGVTARFRKWDVNQDGLLTKEEIKAKGMGTGAPPAAEKGETLEQYLARGKQATKSKGNTFDAERAKKRFERWDTNKDGILTPEEIDARGKVSGSKPAGMVTQ